MFKPIHQTILLCILLCLFYSWHWWHNNESLSSHSPSHTTVHVYAYSQRFNLWKRASSFVLYYNWFKYDLRQKYHAPQVRPDLGSNSWPPDHDSTVHVTWYKGEVWAHGLYYFYCFWHTDCAWKFMNWYLFNHFKNKGAAASKAYCPLIPSL